MMTGVIASSGHEVNAGARSSEFRVGAEGAVTAWREEDEWMIGELVDWAR